MGALRATINWKRLGWDKKLDKWWNHDGLSARQIASKLGVSRGAVLGKVHRMGWSNKKDRVDAQGRPIKRQNDKAMRFRARLPGTKPRPDSSKTKRGINDIVVVDTDPPIEDRVALVNLKAKQCHWPLPGEKTAIAFCGRDKAIYSRAYCAEHHRRAHKPKKGEDT